MIQPNDCVHREAKYSRMQAEQGSRDVEWEESGSREFGRRGSIKCCLLTHMLDLLAQGNRTRQRQEDLRHLGRAARMCGADVQEEARPFWAVGKWVINSNMDESIESCSTKSRRAAGMHVDMGVSYGYSYEKMHRQGEWMVGGRHLRMGGGVPAMGDAPRARQHGQHGAERWMPSRPPAASRQRTDGSVRMCDAEPEGAAMMVGGLRQAVMIKIESSLTYSSKQSVTPCAIDNYATSPGLAERL
ncbi:hypothetical protein B0H13DRAFT_1907419 [Mycena leptocephala]|nr:hypothetical protein B0H13DRAFT_1907419 [Mycena leptocephala]